MAVLARALQLIARREARMREQPESQPCGLTFLSSTNLWLQYGTTSTSSTTSKENTSSKSSYSRRSSNSCTPASASDEAQKSKKRKASPSIYQQEVARKKRERQQRTTTPQDSVDTTSPRSTAISSRLPSPTDTMTPAEAKELISAAVGTQRRHEVYHGTTLVSNYPRFRQI